MSSTKHKVCIACQRVKPLAGFYGHPGMADGHLNKCKECQKTAVKAARAARLEYYREYDRQRANDPSRVAARAAYQQTERGQERLRAGKLAWMERNPEARSAHIIIGNALRDGRLKRGTCRCCGGEGHHAHHNDYNEPLKVWWLCRECHRNFHQETR